MEMNIVGWIVIGFLAGSISGWFVGTRSVEGCLPTIIVGIIGGPIRGRVGGAPRRGEGCLAPIIVGIIGGLIGGWLSAQLGLGSVSGFSERWSSRRSARSRC